MTRLGFVAGLVTVCALGLSLQASSHSRPSAPPKRGPDVLLQLSIVAATAGLAEPVKCVTATGTNGNPAVVATLACRWTTRGWKTIEPYLKLADTR